MDNDNSLNNSKVKTKATKENKDMTNAKEDLIARIETVREQMNCSIDTRAEYSLIYQYSVELDELLNQYMVACK